MKGVTPFNFFILPLKVLCLVTIPYEDNPLVRRKLFPLVTLGSFVVIYFGFFFPNCSLILISVLAATYCLGMGLAYLNESARIMVVNLVVLCAGLAYVKVFTSLMLECFLFLNFLFGFGKRFLSMFLLPFINSAGDIFSLVSLTGEGLEVLSFMSLLPSMLFDMCMDLTTNLLLSRSYLFDIFVGEGLPLMQVVLSVLLVLQLVFLAVFGLWRRPLSKGYVGIGLGIYAGIFLGASGVLWWQRDFN